MGEGGVVSEDGPMSESMTLSANDLKTLLAEVANLVKKDGLDEQNVAEMSAKAAAAAVQSVQERWYDERKYPMKSVFNPAGDLEHPRPDLTGEIYWVGTLLNKAELTTDEITLLNRLEPGLYHKGKWTVTNLEPGNPDKRRLLVLFPCSTIDQRNDLPRSMTAMLREMVEGVEAE